MNNDYQSKKLSYQLQQMAFQKYPFEINNKTFFCLQTYFEDQLLNGVDLQIKQAKGMTSQPQKISYINQSQQIILPIGSNIVSYNAQKRAYSLLTEVNGFVQILRTYTSKINNRTYIFWLQTDQEGLNMKVKTNSQNKLKTKVNQSSESQHNLKKITSLWNLALLGENNLAKSSSKDESNDATKNKLNDGSPKKVKFHDDGQKSKKKVRIQAPDQYEEEQNESKNKKRMRICIFDYEKKALIHKQPLQIEECQTISEIFLYFITEKMIGYVVNDQSQERGKIYYKKIKVDDSYCAPKTSGKGIFSKKRNIGYGRKPQKYNVLDSVFEIPLLKYNGQTDQYLFKDLNTVYSLQVYQVQHQMITGKGGSSKQFIYGQQGSNHKLQSQSHNSRNSIQISDDSQMDEQNLSKEIEQITNKIKTSSSKDRAFQRQKYGVKICQQIELFTDETIVDISISQVYLVVLTNQFIRFYSIFNLNTLLFKCQIHDLKQNPPPSSVQLNKSYVLLTHQNSTLVSSYTILQRKLKYNSTCEVEIQHCQSIIKLFMNSYNCEVAILARQFQIQGRMTNILKSRRIIQNNFHQYKKTYIDLSLAYINFSSTKCQTKALFLKNQRFRNILTCKWHSQYLIETQNQILAKQWRQAFENLKCSCLHPTGQYLIIGFNDCFKIYSVTQQGLQNTYMSDGVKDCQAIAYSQYGQHFAVGSGNTIGIYNSYNCTKKLIIILPMGSLVESLQFRNSHLICLLRTKRIIIYHTLLDYKQIFTFNPKNYLNQNKHELQKKPGQSAQNLLALTIKGLVSIDVNSLYYDLELNVVIFSSGKKIFFLNTLSNQSLGSYDIQGISCMEYNKHLATLFLGTFNGQLIAFPWPNKPSNILSQLPRFKFHSQKIIKIKLTSDFKYLITLGNDMSIYKSHVNYILNLKRLKGNQIAEYKGNKNAVAYCNFLHNKGICQFSHSQTIQKLQNKKQLQEQVVNTVFMLPEQRMKQKQQLFDQLSTTKQQLDYQNMKQYEPLQQQSIGLRNKIMRLKDELINVNKVSELTLQRQKQQYSEQSSKLLNMYSQINYEYRLVRLQLQQQKKRSKQQNNHQYTQLLKQNEIKQKYILKDISLRQRQNKLQKNNFLQINMIEQEKQIFLNKQLSIYQKQFQLLTTKNGQLVCKNSSIQKEILVLKYRIQQLKFVILNATSSISKLTNKQQKQTEEKLVFQNLLVQNAKIDVSQMQKKYIKATKQLIQKNKVIDINLNQYQKQKQILVKLQKTVQGTQAQIDRIVDSLQEQKQFMRYLLQKKQYSTTRYKQLAVVRNNIKANKCKGQLQLKKFIQQIEQLQKQYQNCMNQNKKQLCSQTTQVINKLRQLNQFGHLNSYNNKNNLSNLSNNNNINNKNNLSNKSNKNNINNKNNLSNLSNNNKNNNISNNNNNKIMNNNKLIKSQKQKIQRDSNKNIHDSIRTKDSYEDINYLNNQYNDSNSNNNQNPLIKLLQEYKKNNNNNTNSNFVKTKKNKKLRCHTQQKYNMNNNSNYNYNNSNYNNYNNNNYNNYNYNNYNYNNSNYNNSNNDINNNMNQINDNKENNMVLNSNRKMKISLKINHNKFKEQFNKYRKDNQQQLLCNTNNINNKSVNNIKFNNQTQRLLTQQQQYQHNKQKQYYISHISTNNKLLKKSFNNKNKKYYQIQTQYNSNNSNQTQRINTNNYNKQIIQQISSKLFNPISQNINVNNQLINNQVRNKQNNFNRNKQNNNQQVYRNSCSYQRQKMISRQKQNIDKKVTSQQKLVNKIKNDKKLFMTSKRRLHMQNQDLINTYNSLTYDNKYFKNILRAYEQTLDQQDQNYIFNNPTNNKLLYSKNFINCDINTINNSSGNNNKSGILNKSLQHNNNNNKSGIHFYDNHKSDVIKQQSDINKIMTPFDKYLKNKQTKVKQLKNRCNQIINNNNNNSSDNIMLSTGIQNTNIQNNNIQGNNNNRTISNGFKTTLNSNSKIIKMNKTSQQLKRIKTIPCVQYTI